MKTNIKIIATSLALVSSVGAWAGIGGLSVQSHLGQPFSGSIVVTGDEAEALKSNRRVVVSGSGIRGTVVPQSNGNVVVRLRSSSPIREPMITFTVSAGRQTREYNAMLDPSGYTPEPAPRRVEKPSKEPKRKPQPVVEDKPKPASHTKAGELDFIERNGQVPAHNSTVQTNTLPNEGKPARSTTQKEREPRPARETTARDSTPATTGSVNNVRKSGKTAVTARRYRAQAGETLSSIAERYRPRNMSLQTASRALAMANPSAFKRGNTIQRNTTLYIPSASQWHAYAQRAQSYQAPQRPAAPPRRAPTPQVQTPVDALPDQTPVAQPQPTQQPAAQQPKPAPQPAQQPAAQQPKPAAQPAETAKPTTPPVQQATKPAQPAETGKNAQPAAPAPQPLNAPVTQPAQPSNQKNAAGSSTTTAVPKAASVPAKPTTTTVKTASAPVQAASAVAASKVVTTAASSATDVPMAPMPSTQPVPVSPPAAMTEPADENMEESETDWVLYGGGVGAALLVAMGTAYVLRKRRSESAVDEEEDDDVTWETDVDESPATHTASKSANITSGHDDHDFDVNADDSDFEALPDHKNEADDVFFAPETSTEPKPFSLNDFEPDAQSLEKELISTSTVTHPDDEWIWDTTTTASPDDLEQLAVVGKVEDAEDNHDWSLDHHEKEQSFFDDLSLDKIEQLEKQASHDESDDSAFSEFGQDEDFIQAASNHSSKATAVDDIDAMFANALANLDHLATETEAQSTNKAKPAADLDDIDAMFAGALANLGSNKKTTSVEEDVFDAEDIDSLSAIGRLEDDELAALEQPKKAKPAAAELDDIDAMFAGALANLDHLTHDTHEEDALMAEAELESLDSLGQLDELSPTQSSMMASNTADDELDQLLPNELASLNSLSELDDLDNELASLDSLKELDDLDDELLASDAELASLNSLSELNDLDDELLASDAELDSLNSLSELNDLDDELLASDTELDSLNSLSEFNELALLKTTQPAPLHNDIDAIFANALSEINEPLTNEPIIKPIMSEEDIENLNSLSELDHLEANKPSADDLFANALDDLVVADAEVNDVNTNTLSEDVDSLVFETPVIESVVPEDVVALDDVDAMAFDLSAFDALQNTSTETVAEEAALDDVDAMAFDLSGFDALTEPTTTEKATFDDVDALAFAAPDVPDSILETPVLNTPAVDFDLPELSADLPDELADLEQLTASLDDLETTDEFADFDIMNHEGAGFVSEAVGTGETLEAKLELAKMYIEIEDMDTARGILHELLADAEGEIGSQAKVLLAQIS